MKTLLAVLFTLCIFTAQAQVTFKGGITTTKCYVPAGADFVMDVLPDGYFVATSSVDCEFLIGFTGYADSSGRLRGLSATGALLVGRIKIVNGYYTFTGKLYGSGCTYTVKSAAGVF